MIQIKLNIGLWCKDTLGLQYYYTFYKHLLLYKQLVFPSLHTTFTRHQNLTVNHMKDLCELI